MDAGGHLAGAILCNLPTADFSSLADPVPRVQNDCRGLGAKLPGQLAPLLRPAVAAGGPAGRQRQHHQHHRGGPADEVPRDVARQVVRAGVRSVSGHGPADPAPADDGLRVLHDCVQAVARIAPGNEKLRLPAAST